MNKLFVWLVSFLNPVWRTLGADPKAIGLILAAKLKMDDRGGMLMGQRQDSKSGMAAMIYVFICLFGLLLSFVFQLTPDVATAVGIGFSLWFVYIGLMLVTEMSENLFDQRDLYILLSRPINDLTFSLSRMLHIAVFAGKLGLCLGVPSFLYLTVAVSPWAGFAYFLLSILTIVITITGTLVFYLLLLRRVDSAKVKKIVGYFQIIATSVFLIAYQLPALLGDSKSLENISLVGQPAGFLFPGLWVGGLYKAMTSLSVEPLAYAQAALALVAAAGGFWFYVRQSRGYADSLLQLRNAGSGGRETEAGNVTGGTEEKSPVRDFLAPLLTRPNQERMSFRFHWNLMVRDITFKQKVYPTLVYLPVMLVMVFFRDAFRGEEAFSGDEGFMLIVLYFLLWLLIVPLGQTKISENYRAGWVFLATANKYPWRTNYGQLMAVVGMFFLPMAVVLYTVMLVYLGSSFVLDIVLAMGATLLIALVYAAVAGGHPFSRSKEDAQFSNIGPFLLVSVLAVGCGFIHWAIRFLPYMLPVASVVVWGILLASAWSYRNKGD
jgi:hypothetical protein